MLELIEIKIKNRVIFKTDKIQFIGEIYDIVIDSPYFYVKVIQTFNREVYGINMTYSEIFSSPNYYILKNQTAINSLPTAADLEIFKEIFEKCNGLMIKYGNENINIINDDSIIYTGEII